MRAKKKNQSKIRNEEETKRNAKDVTESKPASKSDVPYLNEDGLMDLNLVPDEVWRRWRRWKRLPRKEPGPAIRRERKRKPKPFGPQKRR